MIKFYAHAMKVVDGKTIVDFVIVSDDYILRYITGKPLIELCGNARRDFLTSIEGLPNLYTLIEYEYEDDFEFNPATQLKIAEAYYTTNKENTESGIIKRGKRGRRSSKTDRAQELA
jgi:hypothetical protein